MAVSYTHLDVYKRQDNPLIINSFKLFQTMVIVKNIIILLPGNNSLWSVCQGKKRLFYILYIRCVLYINVPVSYTHLDVYKRQPLHNILR